MRAYPSVWTCVSCMLQVPACHGRGTGCNAHPCSPHSYLPSASLRCAILLISTTVTYLSAHLRTTLHSAAWCASYGSHLPSKCGNRTNRPHRTWTRASWPTSALMRWPTSMARGLRWLRSHGSTRNSICVDDSFTAPRAMHDGTPFDEALRLRVALLKGMSSEQLQSVWSRLELTPLAAVSDVTYPMCALSSSV